MNITDYAYNTYLLQDGQQPVFTDDQKKAIQAMDDFLQSKDQNIFILKGYAGTGKTFLVRLLSKYCEHQHLETNIMAPTGRAAMVVGTKSQSNTSTIHSGIYDMDNLHEEELKTRDHHDENNQKYKYVFRLKTAPDNIQMLYLIDESSMISDKKSESDFLQFGSGRLLSDLMKYVAPANPNRNTKIIFIGDPAQLPPVSDNESGALLSDYLREEYDVSVSDYEMTEVIRQDKDSGILHNATYLRNLLDKDKKERITFELDTSFEDVLPVQRQEVVEQYKRLNPDLEPLKTISVHYTNASCYDYNQMIRAAYFDNVHEIHTGDLVVLNNNVIQEEVRVYNGTICKVVEIAPNPEIKTNLFTRDKEGKKCTVDLKFRNLKIEAHLSKERTAIFNCKILEDHLFNNEASLSYEDNLAIYFDFRKRMSDAGIKPGTDQYKAMLKKDPYMNSARIKFGYAITCHKAQGGEWKNTMVNMDISQGLNSDYFLRWTYTALTRASENVYLFNIPNLGQFTRFEYQHQLLATKAPAGDEITCMAPDNFNELLQRLELDTAEHFIVDKFKSVFAVSKHYGWDINARLHRDYLEQYTFVKGEEHVVINFSYNGRQRFGNMRVQHTSDTDVEMANELKTELEKSRTIHFYDNTVEMAAPGSQPSAIFFTNEDAPLKALYNQINSTCIEKNIIIKNVIHNNYQERYFFERRKETAVINFIYDGMYQFGKAAPVLSECNSNELLNDLNEIFIEHLKPKTNDLL